MTKTEIRLVYITEDGTEFSSQEAANSYQKKLDLEYLVSHSGISFHDTNAAEVTEWIAEHYEQIKEILG
jgi:dsDNA-binding SOS-regulon protein